MSASVFQNLAHAPQNQITSTVRRELVSHCDSKGQFSHWEVSHFSEELLLNGHRFRKDYSQSVLVDRQVQKPPPALAHSLARALGPACSPSRSSALPFITAPPAAQTARGLSALVPTVIKPLVLTLPFVMYRTVGNDNPVLRIIDRVVQLLTILGGSSEAASSEESKQNSSDKPPGAEGIKGKLLHSKLVALLSEAASIQELQPDIRKAVLDFLNAGNRLHQVEGEKGSLNRELSSVDLFSQSVATENSGVLAQEKLNSAAIKVSQNSTTDMNEGSEGPARQVGAKVLAGSERAGREHGHGERISKAATGSEAVRPDAGNKVNMNQSTLPAMPNQGGSVLNQPSQLLASSLPVAMQPPALAETGQKQLPPIILPNVNPGAGNRSERRKSKKELEEEEEKEREGLSWLFDEDEDEDEEDDDSFN